MKNRGPDDQNYKFINLKKVFLLSSRLKIVDRLDRSNQPMEIEDCIILLLKFTHWRFKKKSFEKWA